MAVSLKRKEAPALAELARLKPFLPIGEHDALLYTLVHGEEAAATAELVREWVERIATMPRTYQQDGLGDNAIVHLHYFVAGSDWYITEKDKTGDGTVQAFGMAVLNGDWQMAELGYISIGEIVQHGGELDLYWPPVTLAKVRQARGG